jgi:MYXO-CTERM domain-containing protein
MRRTTALSTFVLLAGVSRPALADEPPERPKKSAEKKDEKAGCSVSDEDDAMLGLAALALLLSGVALRRRLENS